MSALVPALGRPPTLPWLTVSTRPLIPSALPESAEEGFEPAFAAPELRLGLVIGGSKAAPGSLVAGPIVAWWRSLGARVLIERWDRRGISAATRRLEDQGAAAILVAAPGAPDSDGVPLTRATPVLAPSGTSGLNADEGLASRPEVFSVAARRGTAPAPGSSLGPATELIAEVTLEVGERRLTGALAAAARATLAMARAVQAARRVGSPPARAELRRLVLGLPETEVATAGFYRRHRAVELDGARLEARLLRPRGALLLRDLWVAPAVARPGARVLVTAELESCGRAPASGRIIIGDADGGEQLVRIESLAPGQRRRLRVARTARADPTDSEGAWIHDIEGRPLWIRRGGSWIWPRLDGSGESWDRPVYAGGWVSPEAARVARLELASLREPRPDQLEVTVLNTGGRSVQGWGLRLRSGTRLAGRRPGPVLRAGECCRVSLRLSGSRLAPARLSVELERSVGGTRFVDDELSLWRGPRRQPSDPKSGRTKESSPRRRRDPADSSEQAEPAAPIPV